MLFNISAIKNASLIGLLMLRTVTAQSSFKVSDSLKDKDYDYIFERIEESASNKRRQSVYLDAFLSKAKFEASREEIINGYQNYTYYSDGDLVFVYADSMIYAAQESKDNVSIGSAYLSKGILYYREKRYKQALDNYLIADKYISLTNDNYLKFKTRYNLGHIKYYLGKYDDAISLFKECLTYFKTENSRAYLNTLHSLALCHNRKGDFGLSSDFIKIGIREGERLSNNDMEPYFIHLEGINHYFKNNYSSAIDKIASSLPTIVKNNDFANEAVAYFYIGKSYWNLNQYETALNYFRKMDQISENKDYIRSDLLEGYRLMIDYYNSRNNLKAQLHYIEKFIKADSILDNEYKYLLDKVHSEYDTKELHKEKEGIQKRLDQRKKNEKLLFTTIGFLFFLSTFLIYWNFRNKKLYKQRFEKLMKLNDKPETKTLNKSVLDINPETVNSVLKQLEKFEKNKKYLEQDWTLVKLSAIFNSNTKYLSKIIYHFRHKKFSEYINGLKIDYVIDLLKSDSRIRNYTNKALAEEAGFSSTERFTNAFIVKTGISPTYFIKELKKTIANPNKDIF